MLLIRDSNCRSLILSNRKYSPGSITNRTTCIWPHCNFKKGHPSVALGVAELRVRDGSGNYRLFYYLKSRRGILVFHIFMKKTQKSSQHDISLGRQRLKEVLSEE